MQLYGLRHLQVDVVKYSGIYNARSNSMRELHQVLLKSHTAFFAATLVFLTTLFKMDANSSTSYLCIYSGAD